MVSFFFLFSPVVSHLLCLVSQPHSYICVLERQQAAVLMQVQGGGGDKQHLLCNCLSAFPVGSLVF